MAKKLKGARGAEILKCDCKNTFQDQLYGLGKRVCNQMKEPIYYRCTVCGKTHTYLKVAATVEDKKEKK